MTDSADSSFDLVALAPVVHWVLDPVACSDPYFVAACFVAAVFAVHPAAANVVADCHLVAAACPVAVRYLVHPLRRGRPAGAAVFAGLFYACRFSRANED